MICTAKLINSPALTVPASHEPEDKGGVKHRRTVECPQLHHRWLGHFLFSLEEQGLLSTEEESEGCWGGPARTLPF